jgi:RNA polymerase sigma-70 factor, ECF subfamily
MDVLDRQKSDRRSRLAELSDEGLFMLIHRPEAAEQMFDRLGSRAYGLALKIVGDPLPAQEIVHESFLALRRVSIPLHAPPGSVRRRLTAMVYRRAVSFVRTGTNGDERSDAPEPRDWLGHESIEIDRGRAQLLLRRLPPAQLRVIELAYLHGMTVRDIAAKLDASIEAVRTRMVAGLSGLGASL